MGPCCGNIVKYVDKKGCSLFHYFCFHVSLLLLKSHLFQHLQTLFHFHFFFFCQCGSSSLFAEDSMECGVKYRPSMQLRYFLFCCPCCALTLPALAPFSLASTISPRGTVTLHPPRTFLASLPFSYHSSHLRCVGKHTCRKMMLHFACNWVYKTAHNQTFKTICRPMCSLDTHTFHIIKLLNSYHVVHQNRCLNQQCTVPSAFLCHVLLSTTHLHYEDVLCSTWVIELFITVAHELTHSLTQIPMHTLMHSHPIKPPLVHVGRKKTPQRR